MAAIWGHLVLVALSWRASSSAISWACSRTTASGLRKGVHGSAVDAGTRWHERDGEACESKISVPDCVTADLRGGTPVDASMDVSHGRSSQHMLQPARM
jgi:hypothetical protein